jgi:hypothetical protein
MIFCCPLAHPSEKNLPLTYIPFHLPVPQKRNKKPELGTRKVERKWKLFIVSPSLFRYARTKAISTYNPDSLSSVPALTNCGPSKLPTAVKYTLGKKK